MSEQNTHEQMSTIRYAMRNVLVPSSRCTRSHSL